MDINEQITYLAARIKNCKHRGFFAKRKMLREIKALSVIMNSLIEYKKIHVKKEENTVHITMSNEKWRNVSSKFYNLK